MRWLKLIVISFIFLSGAFLMAKPSFASEGTFEIRSTNNENYRCFAASLLMKDFKYKIIVSCRDLIYPPRPDLFTYVMWATPVKDTKPIKLGALGAGKANFETKSSFSTLFVTLEQSSNPRSPSNEVVMKGSLERITFLDRPTTPTPTPEKMVEEPSQVEEVTELEQLTTREKFVAAIKRAGLVIFLGLVAVVGLVFVLTRPRK